jgi:hypothetical protein
MPIPSTSTLTRDDWINIARCASRRSDNAEKAGDRDRADRELDWWADIILMINT